MTKYLFSVLVLFFLAFPGLCQKNFPVNGVHDERPESHVFINAAIYKDYQTIIDNGVLVIDKGRVVEIGSQSSVKIPNGAQVHDLAGKIIYPAFIDLFSNYGLPEVKETELSFGSKPQLEAEREGAYARNDAINSDYNAVENFTTDKTAADAFRKQGFGTVLTFRPDGIARGTAALVSLSDEPEQNSILREKAATQFSFKRGSSTQSYPYSLMGSAALLRQTYYDAQWYKSPLNHEQVNQGLEAINSTMSLPSIFEADNKYQILLADKVGKEFGINYIVKGAGDEYQRVEEIKKAGNRLIIPLNFPKAYDVEDPYKTLDLSLTKMKHWELAPSNPKILSENGIDYSLTTSGLEEPDKFLTNLRKAVRRGLGKSEALKSLIYNPAQFIKAYDEIGSLESGKVASFFVSTGDIFDDNSRITESWVSGKKYSTLEKSGLVETGEYQLMIGEKEYQLNIDFDKSGYSAKIVNKDTSKADIKVSFKVTDDEISMSFSDSVGVNRLFGWVKGDSLFGKVDPVEKANNTWTAKKIKDPEKGDADEEKEANVDETVFYPFTAYGWTEKPKQETYLIKNATVWTNESEGVLENADVLVSGGKIEKVGKDLQNSNAKVIDGTGKYLTSGIIDEHSHIALFDINEPGEAISSEVRMEDVVNPEDINIYRQISGGVTASQLLHGSANPIGGQSAIVKLRWGSDPRGMLIKDATPFIKFALGENVKQSNWGDVHVVRYPQTRMGVEQVFEDAFTRAEQYNEDWEKFNGLSSKEKSTTPKPRVDLELEALAQILNGKRQITCHSYVQSEINMLMKVADRHHFKVNTFTHILEGYKVADKMKEHGAAGSTFSDWWTYKYEVREAIPYNASLMNEVGVLTAINSDDAEMARRLNQEAAKSLKYGGMSEEEAWKMVTLNPAKMLHLDHHIGSIKPGKDADLVLWNTDPLSIYAKPDFTMIDGAIYFDRQKNQEKNEWVEKERNRLIQLMLKEKQGEKDVQEIKPEEKKILHCDD